MTKPNSERSIFTLNTKTTLDDIFASNTQWVSQMEVTKPGLFSKYNAFGQQPHTLLICCSDSRYNENCLGVVPGEVFTMKTVANICHAEDLTLLATLEFAINCLKINRVIIMGHTDCGGIKTCLLDEKKCLPSLNCNNLSKYLQEIEDMLVETMENDAHFNKLTELKEKSKYLSIVNVKKQFDTIGRNETVINAQRTKRLKVFGLLYNVDTGLLENCIE